MHEEKVPSWMLGRLSQQTSFTVNMVLVLCDSVNSSVTLVFELMLYLKNNVKINNCIAIMVEASNYAQHERVKELTMSLNKTLEMKLN